ncbi:hypothetical protein BDV10DRAFT_96573 [Aspergillus recurvatus]
MDGAGRGVERARKAVALFLHGRQISAPRRSDTDHTVSTNTPNIVHRLLSHLGRGDSRWLSQTVDTATLSSSRVQGMVEIALYHDQHPGWPQPLPKQPMKTRSGTSHKVRQTLYGSRRVAASACKLQTVRCLADLSNADKAAVTKALDLC